MNNSSSVSALIELFDKALREMPRTPCHRLDTMRDVLDAMDYPRLAPAPGLYAAAPADVDAVLALIIFDKDELGDLTCGVLSQSAANDDPLLVVSIPAHQTDALVVLEDEADLRALIRETEGVCDAPPA